MPIFTVQDWKQHQHYKDRSPPWVKLHKSLLDNYEYQCLPVASRALAPMLWLLASESKEGEIQADLQMIAFRLRCTEQDVLDGIIPLIKKGFVVDDSGVLARNKQTAIPETEREVETYKPETETKTTLVDSATQNQLSGAKQIRIDVFNYWQEVTGHKQSKYNDKLDKLLKARMDEGFTTSDLKSAIRGMWKTPHNRGLNDRNTVYDGLDLICRDGANVNRFMNSDNTMPEYTGRVSGLSDAGNHTKQALDAWLAEGAERTHESAPVVEDSGEVYEGSYVKVAEQGKSESPFSMFDEFSEN